jgi:hypothetical protein
MDSTDAPPDTQTTDNRFAMVPLAMLPKLAELSKSALLLYVALKAHEHRTTGLCCPTNETIRKHTALDERSVRRGHQELKAAGIVRTTERPGTSNQYHLCDNMPSATAQDKGGQICPVPHEKGGQICPGGRTELSGEGGQNCPGGRTDLSPITEYLTEKETEERTTTESAPADGVAPGGVFEKSRQGKTTTPKPPPFDPLTVAIPPAIDTPRFRNAWQAWIEHRREIRKPLTRQSAIQQVKRFGNLGVDVSVETIRESIIGGWAGLFPEKVKARMNQINTNPIPEIPRD